MKQSFNQIAIPLADALEHNEKCIFIYGRSVIESRALVDFRDGLLPVQRKILFAAYKMGLTANGATKKSARLVGDVIGKYSPHGDSATYEAAVKMVNSPMPTLDGGGSNFGSMTDDAAAYRYTTIRLSKYGQDNFFDKDLMAVALLIPNFDGTETEPLVLPSILPNLLLNGSFGIAPGITSDIPSFKLAGVAELTKKALRGHDITIKDCLKLECNFSRHDSTSGAISKDITALKNLRDFYKSGTGTAIILPDYTFNEKTRTIRITSIPPRMDMEKILEKCRQDSKVDEATDETSKDDPFLIHVVLKKSLPIKDYKAAVDYIIKKYFTSNGNWKFNITQQFYNKTKEVPYAKLFSIGLPEFFKRWASWRISIELKSLRFKETRQLEVIALQKLLILAATNIDIIMAALKRKDTEIYIQKRLKITAEDVETILSRQIRTLKTMNLMEMKNKLKLQEKELSEIRRDIKNPSLKAIKDIENLEIKLC